MVRRTKEKSDLGKASSCENLSGYLDLNQRPRAPEACVLQTALYSQMSLPIEHQNPACRSRRGFPICQGLLESSLLDSTGQELLTKLLEQPEFTFFRSSIVVFRVCSLLGERGPEKTLSMIIKSTAGMRGFFYESYRRFSAWLVQ